MDTIEIRLQKLETANRRYQRVILLMIAFFATIFMAFRKHNPVPDVIQAKRFEVVDDNGNVLVMTGQNSGNGVMKTYRSDGKRLLNFSYTTLNEGYFGIEDGAGQEMIRLSSSSEGGGGYIGIYNPSGKRTMSLCNEYGGGNVYVNNSEGNNRAALQSNSSAGGFLALYNSSGYTALKLTQTSSGNGDIYVNNYNGDERMRLSVSGSGGNLQLKNNSQTMVVELGATSPGHGIVNTYNSSGSFLQSIGSSY
jgi:hypothetical protein